MNKKNLILNVSFFSVYFIGNTMSHTNAIEMIAQ